MKRLKEQGVVTSWSDASELLEQHDPHRVAFEGEEDVAIVNREDDDTDSDSDTNEDGNDSDDGDDHPPGGGGCQPKEATETAESKETTTTVASPTTSQEAMAWAGAEVGTTPPLTALLETPFKMRSPL